MSHFTELELENRLLNLSSSPSSIEQLSLWIISHSHHFQAIGTTWFKELVKANRGEKLWFMNLVDEIIQKSKNKHPEFIIEFGNLMKKVLEYLVEYKYLNEKTKEIIWILIKGWRKQNIFDVKKQNNFEKIWQDGTGIHARALKRETRSRSTSPKGSPRKRQKLYCDLCQDYGHVFSEACHAHVVCRNCGIQGHVRRDCPKFGRKLKIEENEEYLEKEQLKDDNENGRPKYSVKKEQFNTCYEENNNSSEDDDDEVIVLDEILGGPTIPVIVLEESSQKNEWKDKDNCDSNKNSSEVNNGRDHKTMHSQHSDEGAIENPEVLHPEPFKNVQTDKEILDNNEATKGVHLSVPCPLDLPANSNGQAADDTEEATNLESFEESSNSNHCWDINGQKSLENAHVYTNEILDENEGEASCLLDLPPPVKSLKETSYNKKSMNTDGINATINTRQNSQSGGNYRNSLCRSDDSKGRKAVCNKDHPPSKRDHPPFKLDYPPSKQDHPPSKRDHPPSKPDYPSSKLDYPSSKLDYPSSKRDHPTSKRDHPPSKPDYPSSKLDYPSSKLDYPSSKRDHPPSKRDHPPSKLDYPPSKLDYPPSKRDLMDGNFQADVTHGGDVPQKVLFFTMLNSDHPISINAIYKLCNKAIVNIGKVIRFKRAIEPGQFMVEFDSQEAADVAKDNLHGIKISKGSCTLSVQYAQKSELTVDENNELSWDFTTGFTSRKKRTQSARLSQGRGNRINRHNSRVILVYTKTPEKVNCKVLYNLFSQYGKIIRISLMRYKEGCAMVEMKDPEWVEKAIRHLHNVKLFGRRIELDVSKYMTTLNKQNIRFSLPDGTISSKDYSLYRNKNMNLLFNAPSKCLLFQNVPKMEESRLHWIFFKNGAPRPRRIQWFQQEFKTRGLMEFDSIEESCDAIALVNHVEMEIGNVPYIMQVYFTSATF